MPIHIHLHDRRTKDYGTSEGAKKRWQGGGMNSPQAHAQRAANRQAGENRAGYKASMARQGKPVKPQFQQALGTAVKNIKAERPQKPKDPEKEYQARIKRLARDDSVSRFFDSSGGYLAPELEKKSESPPDTDLSDIPEKKKEGVYREGPFSSQVHQPQR